MRKRLCPKCASTDVRHKDDGVNRTAKRMASTAGAKAGLGNPTGLFILAGTWLAGKAVNSLRNTWTCNKCGYRFS